MKQQRTRMVLAGHNTSSGKKPSQMVGAHGLRRWVTIVFLLAIVASACTSEQTGGDISETGQDVTTEGFARLEAPEPYQYQFETLEPSPVPIEVPELGDPLNFEIAGLELDPSGEERFEWRDPHGLVFDNASGEGRGTIMFDTSPEVGVIDHFAIVADEAVVGRIAVSGDGVTTAVDVNPARPGFELVEFEGWPGDVGQTEVEPTVIASKAGIAVDRQMDIEGGSTLCRLPGTHPELATEVRVVRIDCSAVVADVSSGRSGHVTLQSSDPTGLLAALVPLPGLFAQEGFVGEACPISDSQSKGLEQLIDELENEAAIRFGERHADLNDLLNDRPYWEGVIDKHLKAVGIPTSGNLYDIVTALDPGVAGSFWKAFRADLLGSGGVAFDRYLMQRGLPSIADAEWTYKQQKSLRKNYSDIEEAFRAGIKDGGTPEAFEKAIAAQDARHLAKIREHLQNARNSLDTGFLGGDPTFSQRRNAYAWYDKALDYLREHTSYAGGATLSDKCEVDERFSFDSGGAYGVFKTEPHMRTFDGYNYDFQAAGEFVLTRAETGDIEVHVRFVPWASSRAVTWGQAFGINVLDDQVTGTFREPNVVAVNGEQLELGPGEAVALPSGGRVVYVDDRQGRVDWPDGSSVGFYWAPNSIGLRVEIAPTRFGMMSGLLGDADGRSAAELVTADGEGPTASQASEQWEWIHSTFADSWRVTDRGSLLPYGPGEDTSTFTDRSVPDQAIAFSDFDVQVIESAHATCLETGLIMEPWVSNCVYDVAVTEEPGFAVDSFIDQEATLERFHLDLGENETTFIAPDTVGRGSASVQPERPIDAYGVDLAAGERMWMETIPDGWPSDDPCDLGPPARALFMRLIDPDGIPVTEIREIANNCPRSTLEHVAETAGTYWLVVGGINPAVDQWADANLASSTTYGLSISKPSAPDEFAVKPGDLIGPGTHGNGSGVLEVPGATDVMTAELEAGDQVGLQPVSFNGECTLGPGPGFTYTVRFGDDSVVLNEDERPIQDHYITDNCFYAAEGAYSFEAPAAGEYSIEISGNYDLARPRSGSYEVLFHFLEVLLPDQ